jgi:hypothetical protein
VQARGLRAQQVLDAAVGVQHRRLGWCAVPQRVVDVGERRDEVASPRSARKPPGLELAESVDGQAEVVFSFQFLDFGVEEGL